MRKICSENRDHYTPTQDEFIYIVRSLSRLMGSKDCFFPWRQLVPADRDHGASSKTYCRSQQA